MPVQSKPTHSKCIPYLSYKVSNFKAFIMGFFLFKKKMYIMYFCVSTTNLQLLSRSENLPIQILINQYLDKYNLI